MNYHIATEEDFPKLPMVKEKFDLFRVIVYDFNKLFYVELVKCGNITYAFGKTKKKALKKALQLLKKRDETLSFV
ncbi:MAG: hypothetical protein U9R27_06805 [Campylobacterota bacterium]|nr:hypothetical protein [Campylobacterota bacterium]